MPIVFNPNVGNFRIDPITGEVVLLNSDGSFTTLNKNVDGTYTASSGRDCVCSKRRKADWKCFEMHLFSENAVVKPNTAMRR